MGGIPERPKGGGHLAAMNCVGKLQRDLHQCCGILVKPLSSFFGYPPFDFIFKFLLMAFFSHDCGQLSHPFPLSLPDARSIVLALYKIVACTTRIVFLTRHSVSLARCGVVWFLSRTFILRSGCFAWWLVCFFSDIPVQRLCCGMVAHLST